jgi:uncharacterized membrane protein YphA (DoxX/SURF4 family)
VDVAIWAASLVLAAIVVAAGLEKLLVPYRQLKTKRAWVAEADRRAVTALGLAEVAGGIGVIVPALTGIARPLTPIAAACLAVLMVGALVVEVRHDRAAQGLALPMATLVLALAVGIGRVAFGPF